MKPLPSRSNTLKVVKAFLFGVRVLHLPGYQRREFWEINGAVSVGIHVLQLSLCRILIEDCMTVPQLLGGHSAVAIFVMGPWVPTLAVFFMGSRVPIPGCLFMGSRVPIPGCFLHGFSGPNPWLFVHGFSCFFTVFSHLPPVRGVDLRFLYLLDRWYLSLRLEGDIIHLVEEFNL